MKTTLRILEHSASVLSTVFTFVLGVWMVNMPNTFDWIYKCPVGINLCTGILNGIIIIIGWVLFAIVFGIAWDQIKKVFIKIPTVHCWTETPGLQKVFVKIDNQTHSDFVDPRVELKSFNRIKPNNHKTAITEMGTSNHWFSKDESSKPLRTIPGGLYSLVAIAEIRNHKLWYRLDQEYNERQLYSHSRPTQEGYTEFSNQAVELVISGKMNGELKKIPFKGRIKFERVIVGHVSATTPSDDIPIELMPVMRLDHSTVVWNEGIRNEHETTRAKPGL